MTIALDHRTVTRILATIIGVLLLAQLAGRFSAIVLGRDTVHGLIPLLNMDEERNLPTFYSALAILLSAALLATVTVARRRTGAGDALFWGFLTAVFLVMAFDELFELHERLNGPVRSALSLNHDVYFAWTIPMAIYVAAVVAVGLRFVLRLPPDVRRSILLAGAVFVTGAMGMEVLGGLMDRDPHNLARALVITLEETLEMTGILLFIRALMLYLEHLAVSLRFTDID